MFILKYPNRIFIGLLVGLNLAAFLILWQSKEHDDLRLYMFDIGQGDSFLIETPSRKQILIDGGPSSRVVRKLGSVLPFFDRSLDLVLLTHTDKDHIAGVVDVLKRYKTSLIVETGIKCTSSFCLAYNLVKEDQLKQGALHIIADIGEVFDFQDGVRLTILYPFESLDGREVKKPNTTSILVRLEFGGRSILFAGDMPEQTEEKIRLSGLKLDSDILKVAHHGSRYSSSDDFLKAVSPEIALISVGKGNSYGHPTQEALNRLANAGATIYRTDTDSDLVFHISKDGKIWREKNKI